MNEDIESWRFSNAAQVTAICLMSNHTHEVLKINSQQLFSKHMRRHHSRYGMLFNRESNRCGKVAQDRPKTCLIEDISHQMRAIFYIDANPIRAGIVQDPAQYRWSTYKLYAFGKKEPWMRNISIPDWYKRLGRTAADRQRAYRRLFAKYLKAEGLRKQYFHQKLFYGSHLWVRKQESLEKQWRMEHDPTTR